MEIKNLKKAAQRLKLAIKNKERIILYGDSDMDGVSSVIIAKEAIENLGDRVTMVYFPNRESEGYGITKLAIEKLKDFSPCLLVVFDCGISNFEEVKEANKVGLEIIIVDHHEVLDKLPKASIIVNPKQKGDKSKFKYFPSAVLSLKLAEALLGEKYTDSLKRNFFELAALAIIADMMPQEDENQQILEEGLLFLEKTFRPGLRAFLDLSEIKKLEDIKQKAQEIISLLNIVEPRENLNLTFLVLLSNSIQEAQESVDYLIKKREEKRFKIKEITNQVEERIGKKEEKIIFEYEESWPIALLGAVASRICEKYKKPTFIIGARNKISRGSVRAPQGIDSVSLMKKCSTYLLSFGGHAPASGFTIETDKLENFKKCLIENL